MYYLLLIPPSDTDVSVSVLITQLDKTIIQLKDGVSTKLVFEDKEDISKHMIIGVPEGDSLISFTVKTLTENFYPKLYYQFYEDIETSMKLGKITFPPLGSDGFSSTKKWDPNLSLLSHNLELKKVKGINGGLALTLFDSQMERTGMGEVVITMSYSNEQKMVLKMSYLGSLYGSQFKLYKLD